jgi:hypothetical protein
VARTADAGGERVVVIGAGIAGCAAAAALAAHGAQVLVLEAGRHLGGVAVTGEHRTLCGLAPIDAVSAELLEPELVAPWLPYLADGGPSRRGRVWLWPTSAATLHGGLARRLAELAVEVRCGWRVTALHATGDGGGRRISALDCSAGQAAATIAVSAVVDASGRGVSAACLGLALAPPVQWPAHRSVLQLDASTRAQLANRSQRLTLLARIAAAGAAPAGFDLTPMAVAGELWQLSLDAPPGSSAASAAGAAAAISALLGAELVACARALAERDEGRPEGGISLAELFACRTRGLCWAAWPAEVHGPEGVRWTWPLHDRHGVPEAALRLRGAPANLWLVGKGMAVEAEAAAALRVTGTCLALGAAAAALVAGGQRSGAG